MANGITSPRRLINLADVPFQEICRHLDTQGLESLFDVMVRQQALLKKTQQAPDISFKVAITKAQHSHQQDQEFASWASKLLPIHFQNLGQALNLPPDSVVHSMEEALKLKRSLTRQPFSAFKEEVMNCLANYLWAQTDQQLYAFYYYSLATRNPLCDHILTILWTAHPQLLDRLVSLNNNVNLARQNLIIIQGRDYIHQGRNDLFSQLVPQCQEIYVLQNWIQTMREVPWNQDLFLSLISSPMHQNHLEAQENDYTGYSDCFFNLLKEHNLKPLQCLLSYYAQVSPEKNPLGCVDHVVHLVDRLIYTHREGALLLMDHLLHPNSSFFQTLSSGSARDLISLFTMKNCINQVTPMLTCFQNKREPLWSEIMPFMMRALALSRGHHELAAKIMESPAWINQPLNQAIADNFPLAPFLETYKDLFSDQFLETLLFEIAPFSDSITDYIANQYFSTRNPSEDVKGILQGLSLVLSPGHLINLLNTPAIMQELMLHRTLQRTILPPIDVENLEAVAARTLVQEDANPDMFDSIFISAIIHNFSLQDSTLLDFVRNHPQLAGDFERLEQHIQTKSSPEQISYIMLAGFLESQGSLMFGGNIRICSLFTEENIPHIAEQFIKYGLQNALVILCRLPECSEECLHHLRTVYQNNPEILALLERNA